MPFPPPLPCPAQSMTTLKSSSMRTKLPSQSCCPSLFLCSDYTGRFSALQTHLPMFSPQVSLLLPRLSFLIPCQNLCIFRLCSNLCHENFLVLTFSCFKRSWYFIYTHHRTMHSSSDRQTDRQTPRNCISLTFVSPLEPLCSAHGGISSTLTEVDRSP